VLSVLVTCPKCEADLVDEGCPACDGLLVEVELVVGEEPEEGVEVEVLVVGTPFEQLLAHGDACQCDDCEAALAAIFAGADPTLSPFTREQYEATLMDLADGERRWKEFARRRGYQMEVALELLLTGMPDAARQYLQRALAERFPGRPRMAEVRHGD